MVRMQPDKEGICAHHLTVRDFDVRPVYCLLGLQDTTYTVRVKGQWVRAPLGSRPEW